MARWRPDARSRLAQAALDLYEERGFEGTTVAEIAERAGLTKRTFFRHFADKREVLFDGGDRLQGLVVGAIAQAPDDAPPFEVVALGLRAALGMFDDIGRERASARQRIIDAHPELQEREQIKMTRLASAVAAVLRERGVKEPAASLAAGSGVTVFRVAFEGWVAPGSRRRLDSLLDAAFAELRAVAAA